jgi:Mor family transcriptional regulator
MVRRHEKRDKQIVSMRDNGMFYKDIAAKFGISTGRVWYIVRLADARERDAERRAAAKKNNGDGEAT